MLTCASVAVTLWGLTSCCLGNPKWQHLTFPAGQQSDFHFPGLCSAQACPGLVTLLGDLQAGTRSEGLGTEATLTRHSGAPCTRLPQCPALPSVSFQTCRSLNPTVSQQAGLQPGPRKHAGRHVAPVHRPVTAGGWPSPGAADAARSRLASSLGVPGGPGEGWGASWSGRRCPAVSPLPGAPGDPVLTRLTPRAAGSR